MKKYNLVNNNLTEGQKITIVCTGGFGGMFVIQTTYSSCKPVSHYYNCPDSMCGVSIRHTPKGKRKLRQLAIGYDTSLVIYNGWHNIDADSIIYNTSDLGDGITQESKYTMHDNKYFADLLKIKPNGIICTDII